ncbi:MAG: hypothetical protein R3F65_05645 [bacterium]
MSVILALVFGLFGDPSGLVDKYYVRITDPAELPDMNRMTPRSSRRTRSSVFGTGRYGWDPLAYHRSGQRLGLRPSFIASARRWISYELRAPSAVTCGSTAIRRNRTQGSCWSSMNGPASIELRDWSESDRARGYSGRVGVAGENEIYRWFEWLTEPLTPGEAASPPAAAPGPGGDVAP